jgi:hypothetical protein
MDGLSSSLAVLTAMITPAALSTTHAEMDFIWRTSKRLVPKELVEETHYVHFRKKKD